MVSDVKRKRGNKWSEDEHCHTATNANIIVMLEKIFLNARKILSGTARCAGPTPTATARWAPRSGGGWRATWCPSSSSAHSSTSPGSSRQSWSVSWYSLQISILFCSRYYVSSAVQNVDKHLLSEMEYLISDWIVLLFHGVLFSKSQLNFLFDVRCVSILNSNQRCPNCPPHSQYWDQNTTAAPCLGTQSNTVH